MQLKDQKWRQEVKDLVGRIPAKPFTKRPRMSLTNATVKGTIGQKTVSIISNMQVNLIDYWRKKGIWSKKYFKKHNNIKHLLVRKKSLSFSFHWKQLKTGFVIFNFIIFNNQKPREVKSALY